MAGHKNVLTIKSTYSEIKQGQEFIYGVTKFMKVDCDDHYMEEGQEKFQAVYMNGHNKGWLCFFQDKAEVEIEGTERRKGKDRRK